MIRYISQLLYPLLMAKTLLGCITVYISLIQHFCPSAKIWCLHLISRYLLPNYDCSPPHTSIGKVELSAVTVRKDFHLKDRLHIINIIITEHQYLQNDMKIYNNIQCQLRGRSHIAWSAGGYPKDHNWSQGGFSIWSLDHTLVGGRVDHIFKSCLFFFQHVAYPIIIYKDRYQKKIRSIGGGLGVHQAPRNIRPKYKGSGHNIQDKFCLAITFYRMHLSI